MEINNLDVHGQIRALIPAWANGCSERIEEDVIDRLLDGELIESLPRIVHEVSFKYRNYNDDEPENEKYCSKCFEWKDVSNFSFRADSKTFRGVCRECRKQQRLEGIKDYESYLKEQREKARIQRKEKPEINLNAVRLWRANNREKYIAYRQSYRKKNRLKLNTYLRQWKKTKCHDTQKKQK